MTIRNTKNPEDQTPPAGVSSEFVESLLKQLPEEERIRLLQQHTSESHPVVIEDKEENKLANINFQKYGVRPIEFHFVQEYLTNGYNATQAYMTVNPGVQSESAKAMGSKLLHRPKVREFLTACMNALGMSNMELERRLESMIDADPLDAFDITDNKLTFNHEKAKRMGISRRITSVKQGKYGLEISFVPVDRLMDIATKVRGMQKKVSITKDLDKIAEGNDVEKDELSAMLELIKGDMKGKLIARDKDNGIEIYENDD